MDPNLVKHDIERFPLHVDKVVDAQGGFVPDIDTRHGRRALTRTNFHPDCDEAILKMEETYDRLEAEDMLLREALLSDEACSTGEKSSCT